MKHVSVRLATAVVWALLGFQTACTTMTPIVADTNGERIRAEIKAGDTVRVLSADGSAHAFKVTEVGESSLTGGTNPAGSRIELPYRDIRQIEVQRVSSSRTTATVLALVLVGAIAIASGGGSHTPGYTR